MADPTNMFAAEADAMQQAQAQQQPSAAPPTPDATFDSMGPYQQGTGAAQQLAGQQEQPLGNPTSWLDAAAGGAAKAVYETKDFLTGTTPEDQRSQTRRNIEQGVDALSRDNMSNGFVAGLSQFAVGMLGAGKVAGALKGVGLVGKGIEAATGALGETGAEIAGGVAKSASVGAVAFSPTDPRLSNLVQSVPALANPVTGFLAAKPDDGAALGRAKAAMESIGIDAVTIGLFTGALKLLKAHSAGDAAAAEAAHEETARALQAQTDKAAEAEAAGGEQDAGKTAATLTKDLREPPGVGPTSAGDASTQGPAEGDRAAEAGVEGAAAGDRVAAQASDTGIPKDSTVSGHAPLEAESVQVVKNATAGAGEEGLPPKPSVMSITDPQVQSLIAGSRADTEALLKSGSWDAAIDDGHTFASGDGIPWQKMAQTTEGQPETSLDAFTARVAETLKEPLDAAKGGDVMSDARVDRMVQQRAALWGEDPAALMGLIQGAGKDASSMAANMEAAFLVGQRSMQDAWSLAARINAGYLDEFGGSVEAAHAALKQNMQVAATAWGAAQSMRSNAGRTMRRLRGEFQLSPSDVANLQALDGEQLAKLMAGTQGNPRAIAMALKPPMWKRLLDASQFLLVNNLISGPLTHVINFTTNLYMVGSRPFERIVGGTMLGGEAGANIRAQALKQYTYMGASLVDSWRSAVQAFKDGDSIIAPHNQEAFGLSHSLGQDVAQMPWNAWDNIPHIFGNAAIGAVKALGLPSRFVGMVDELVKQVVYRSKVLAEAHVEGVSQGLDADALNSYVRNRLFDAFDDAGRAVDTAALNEAKTATYQQELLPNTLGASVQYATSNVPMLRYVLPFVKTPTNIIRTAWQLTPGLNMLQTQYRNAILGKAGADAQAQAMGQMAMGSLFMGTGALLAANGRITGGPPSDPKALAALHATGWREYSFVFPHSDGSPPTYVPYGRFDPMALPFGMIADIVDALKSPTPAADNKAQNMMMAMLVSMAKNLTSKTYLESINQVIEALTEPDKKVSAATGQLASNFIPFASAMRQMGVDPDMREARDFISKIKATLPGFAETLPPKRDWAGDPITVHHGLWQQGPHGLVDEEVARMAKEQGVELSPPSPRAQGNVDLRQITTATGQNAYDRLQELAAQPTPRTQRVKDVVAKLMQTDAYAKAPDGEPDVKGTKLHMLMGPIEKYRSAAEKLLRLDPNVRAAEQAASAKVRAAYSAANPNPTRANQTSDALDKMGAAFGVDLHALTQGAATQPGAQ